MKQYGSVLVFKPGIDRRKIEEALEKMIEADLVDTNYYISGIPRVNDFDPAFGGPVWYIP